jgi:hypothetical protein
VVCFREISRSNSTSLKFIEGERIDKRDQQAALIDGIYYQTTKTVQHCTLQESFQFWSICAWEQE